MEFGDSRHFIARSLLGETIARTDCDTCQVHVFQSRHCDALVAIITSDQPDFLPTTAHSVHDRTRKVQVCAGVDTTGAALNRR